MIDELYSRTLPKHASVLAMTKIYFLLYRVATKIGFTFPHLPNIGLFHVTDNC
jgi:hypothetical protein